MEKYNISRSGYLPKLHDMLCLPRKVTLQLQDILRLPHPWLWATVLWATLLWAIVLWATYFTRSYTTLSYLIVVILKLCNSELWHPSFLWISFHILLHPFISFHIFLVKNPCISYHFISFLAALLDLIWRNDPCADERYCSIFVRLAALELYHLHLGSVWWMSLDTLPARKFWKEGGFRTYVCKYFYIYTCSICMSYIIYVDLIPFCGDNTGRTWNSHINRDQSGTSHISGRFAWALIPEEIVVVWIANSLICFKTFCIKKIKFDMSIHNLGFCILGFYHRVQWRGAKTAGKKFWGPCHGLIPSLWDFAQNCSLQIEHWNQNWRGTSDSLDSEEAVEPCISTVTKDCLSWSTLDSATPSARHTLPEWQAEVEYKMPCVNILQLLESANWCANTWKDCSERQLCKGKTGFLEQSWWPEFDMFGSMPLCLFPWHKLLPRLAQKNCHTTVWIWSMTHSFFSPKVIVASLPRKAFPWK